MSQTLTTHRVGRAARAASGLTAVEMAVTLGVVAVLLGTAIPGLQELRQRRQAEAIAAQLETDLQLARAEAVARNDGVRMAFHQDTTGSCYVMHTGPAAGCRCDSGGATLCMAGSDPLRSFALGPGTRVHLRANSGSLVFDPVKGTVTPTTTIRIDSPAGQIRVVVNVMGRVRTCAPEGGLAGYPRC